MSLHDHRHGVEIVGGDVEEALDLPRMQIDGQHAIGARFGDEVGHQLGRDRRAGADFAVLPRIAEIGDHRGDAPRARAPQRIDDDEQFHQMVVGRIARRLDDEHVLAAHILLHLDEHFHVGEAAHHGLGEGQLQRLADGVGERAVGIARDQLHAAQV